MAGTLTLEVRALGHTHFESELMEKGIGKMVVANQQGYYVTQMEAFVRET